MTTFPLTPSGAESKLKELYSLSDVQLAIEANAIYGDFSTWISTNFTLTSFQSDCLSEMTEAVVRYFGAQCSICFSYRLNIVLVDPGAPSPSGYGKWSESSSTVKLVSGPTGTSATGELTFKMVYKSL